MESINNGSASPNSSKYRSLICYICGREFGTKSLKIHLKTCKQKWEWEENKKPKKERRPLPEPSAFLEELLNKETIEIDEIESFNNYANEKYLNESLLKCEFCRRTFFNERMIGHKKICTKERPLNPLPDKNIEKNLNEMDDQEFDKPECKICGEKINSNRLEKHENRCKRKKMSALLELQMNKASTINEENTIEDSQESLKYIETFVISSHNIKIDLEPKLAIDKKNNESIVKKVKVEKKREKNFSTSPKPKEEIKKNQLSKKTNINNFINNNALKSETNNSLGQEKKVSFDVEESPKNKKENKALMVKTPDNYDKKLRDRKKSAFNNNYNVKKNIMQELITPKNEKKKFEVKEFFSEIQEDKKIILDDDIIKHAYRIYKIYMPQKMVDFNY